MFLILWKFLLINQMFKNKYIFLFLILINTALRCTHVSKKNYFLQILFYLLTIVSLYLINTPLRYNNYHFTDVKLK